MTRIPPPHPQGSGGPPVPLGIGAPPLHLQASSGRLRLSNAAPVSWALTPGVDPNVDDFVIAHTRGESWLRSVGSEPIALNFNGRVFRNLYVVRVHQTEPFRINIKVADRRYWWRYPKHMGRYNLRRRINDLTRVTDLADDVDIGEEAERDDFRTIQEERYRRWSVKKVGGPWTAKELSINILRALMIDTGDAAAFDVGEAKKLPDNGEVVDGLEYLGNTYTEVLGYLLNQAELSVTVDQDGMVRMYDPYAPLVVPDSHIKGGSLRISDNSRIRPFKTKVYAIAEHDRRGVFLDTGDGDDDPTNTPPEEERQDDSTFKFINVAKIPVPMTIDGVERDPGEIVRFNQYIDAVGIPEVDVRDGWFFGGEGLKQRYARRVRGGKVFYDPVMMKHIATILADYRQYFQIEPKFLDQLRSWDAVTTTIISDRYHTRQPSPIYTRWYDLFPSIPLVQRRGPADKVGENNSSWFEVDAAGNFQETKDPPETAPATITDVDMDLGTLRIGMHPAFDGGVAERIPSNVDNPPEAFNTGTRQVLQFFTKNSKLSETHRLEVVISVIEGTPNASEEDPLGGKKPHLVATFTNTQQQALGPTLELFIRDDTARFSEDGELKNSAQIRAMAKAEALAATRSYLDRPVGVLTLAHNPRVEWKLSSHVRQVKFVRTDNDETVVLDAGEPPVPQRPIAFLPPNVRAFLQRRVPTET